MHPSRGGRYEAFAGLMETMLVIDPEHRPDCVDLMECEFFTKEIDPAATD